MQGVNKLLIVARRFWPCTTDATLRLRSFVRCLASEKWTTTILTPRWHASWSEKVTVGDTSVIRLGNSPSTRLRQTRYRKELESWLQKNHAQFNAVWCEQSMSDASLVLECLSKNRVPIVVRVESDECSTQESVGSLDRVHESCESTQDYPMASVVQGSNESTDLASFKMATAVVVPTPSAHQKAIAIGIPAEQLVRFSHCIGPFLDRSPVARQAARRALANVNGDLSLHRADRLLVIPGELIDSWNIEFVIQSIGRLIDQRPNLRMWILGDGPHRERIYNRLQHYGIHRVVAMPGIFTSVDEILQAADLCLFPGLGCGSSYWVPTCTAGAIPFLAARTQDLVHQLGKYADPLTFHPESYDDFRCRIHRWLDAPQELETVAADVQRTLRRQLGGLSYASGIATYLRLHPGQQSSVANNPNVHSLRLAQ